MDLALYKINIIIIIIILNARFTGAARRFVVRFGAGRFTRLPGGDGVASRLCSKSLPAVFALRFAAVRKF